MLEYRHALVAADRRPLTGSIVESVCDDVIAPRHFFVTKLFLQWSRQNEEPYWEIFHGHALDQAKTRQRARFDSWWVHPGPANEPLLALRWDRTNDEIYVTRAIECRVQEGFESAAGVFETSETTKWVRELVGTARTADLKTAGRLRDELSGLLLQAVIGVSRLPLTSLESPLPAFTLGQLAYCFDERSLRQNLENDPIDWCCRVADGL